MIQFKNVSFHYGKDEEKVTALNNIDFTIRDGEHVAILGPNGSGKSTLARHINGLLLPSQGEVFVDGLSTRERDTIWQIRQRVGMVFQNPDNQIVAASVEEDVAFGPENLGLGRDEILKRVEEALEIVNMVEYARHEPHLLSGGQKQRVVVAGALAMKPKYLVFDEATSMLDFKGGAEVTGAIRKLNKNHGITVINITHDADEALLADRVVVLSGGSILSDGTPGEVFSDIESLQAVGVGIPKARLIAEELASAGIDIPKDILSIDELVNALC